MLKFYVKLYIVNVRIVFMQYKKLLILLCLPVIWYFNFAGYQKEGTDVVVQNDIKVESELDKQTQASVVSDITSESEPYSFGGEVVLTDDLMIDTKSVESDESSVVEDINIPEIEEDVSEPATEFWCPEFILYESYVPESVVTDVLSYYCLIPENVRTWFQTYGYQIHIRNDINTLYGYSYKIKAVTVPGEKKIYVDNRSGVGTSIIHEVGHAVAYENSNIVYCDDFQVIYTEELPSFISIANTHSNNYSTVWEYFAEAYENCILNGTEMQTACPKTYDYILTYMNNL